MTWPDSIRDLDQLEDLLSEPTPGVIDSFKQLDGDVILLGAGGKMGPSLARMVRRAADAVNSSRRVIAVSRFSDPRIPEQLAQWGVETLSGNLLDPSFLIALPDAPNVIYMTGAKFGTSGDASYSWGMNVWLPSQVARRYAGSRIAAFSTGNVYPLVSPESGGSQEEDTLQPVGEYAMTAVGRERMFEFFSRQNRTAVSLVRLNYAVEMRYGVLVDLARKVLQGIPIDLSMGYANVIWQGDANAMTIQALTEADSPPYVINVAGPEIFSTQQVCQRFGELLGQRPNFQGEPAPTALLNNGTAGHRKFGPPRVNLEQLQVWIADWLQRDMPTWEKPTHFEVRDGKF